MSLPMPSVVSKIARAERCVLPCVPLRPQGVVNIREDGTDRDALALHAAADFLRQFWLQVAAISAVLLIPCFWHQRIEASDLGSHVYNAWLAQLIERGQAPGLYLARQWNNVLFDLLLLKLGNLFGFAVAQKIGVSLCVLIFFWGAFALIAAVARRPPWFLLPCLAMLAYGWTFNVGFFNYYLSLGLGFFATAIVWSGRCTELILAATIAGLVLIAHPQGFVWLAGCVGYVVLWRLLPGWWKLAVPGAAVLAVVVARLYLMTHYESFGVWDTFSPGIYNGSHPFAAGASLVCCVRGLCAAGCLARSALFGLGRRAGVAADDRRGGHGPLCFGPYAAS